MAVEDGLVTKEEVKQEGTINNTKSDTDITYRIPKSIENILYLELELSTQKQIKNLLDDNKKKLNVKWAVIYDVLAWLENEGKISGKNMDITSVKDSIASISYNRRSKSEEIAKSYGQLSKDYINRLKRIKHVGGTPRC